MEIFLDIMHISLILHITQFFIRGRLVLSVVSISRLVKAHKGYFSYLYFLIREDEFSNCISIFRVSPTFPLTSCNSRALCKFPRPRARELVSRLTLSLSCSSTILPAPSSNCTTISLSVAFCLEYY